jgi:glycosyltransferase involved in cell wall biosynthesis
LFVVSEKPAVIGGLERYAICLAGQLSNRSIPVLMACPQDLAIDIACKKHNVPTLPYDARNTHDILGAFRLAQAIARNDIDVVHVHGRRDFFPAIMAVIISPWLSRRKRPRLVLHLHQLSRLAVPSKFLQWAFSKTVDVVFAVSHAARETALQEQLVDDHIVRVLHNGVDIDAYTHATSKSADLRKKWRRQWGFGDDAFVVGMVGRLCDKGQRQFLRVMPQLLLSCPKMKLVLVGPFDSDEYAVIISDIQEKGLAGRVMITGPVATAVPEMMTAFDAFVHLPKREAFGLVLAEAGAAGLPVVVSNVGGCPEVIQNGVNGILVERDDDEALIEAARKLCDPVDGVSLMSDLGNNGRRIVEDKFSLSKCVDKIVECYRDLCTT